MIKYVELLSLPAVHHTHILDTDEAACCLTSSLLIVIISTCNTKVYVTTLSQNRSTVLIDH